MSQQLPKEFLVQLANEFGTPLYVYNTEKIQFQFNRLKNAFTALQPRFFYACKALTNINILRYVKSIGSSVDCSSINEVKLALKAGFEPDNILYTSSNISFEEIQEAVTAGVHINIDSLSNLEKFAKKYGHSYPVGIRLRPNIMAGGNLKISTGHESSKFGIPLEQVDKVYQLMKDYQVQIRCLQIHTGSEISDPDVFVKGIEVLFSLTTSFPELEVLDLGGGFHVAYKEGDVDADVELLAQKIQEAVAAYEKNGGKKIQLWFEPGKFLASAAGYFITKVNVIKQTPTITFAGIDSGLNHLIRPMFYGSYHRIENISNTQGELHEYNIVGNICETDTFATARKVNEIREGDYLVFYNAGAYGFEMASNYNSRFKPAEVLVKDGNAHLIRRRDNLDDLLRNQLNVL